MIGATFALLLSGAARADAPDNWKFTLDGYFRTRAHVFDLYEGQAKAGTYMQNRLRLQPGLNFEERAKFFMMVDALDGVVWGDNESLASTALFAGDPSNTGGTGTTVDALQLKRAWMEFKIPVGLIRIGRQPSNWGMGLLANDGTGFDDTFGENKYGSTYDRFIFATRPITVATTIAGKPKDVPLIAAIGVDRLVEDPLIQYYGYSCSVEDQEDGCEPLENHGVTEERSGDQRSDSWWVDTGDDVWEAVYVLMYKGEGIAMPGGRVGDLTVGMYAVNRQQWETDSNVLIVDGYLKAEVAGILAEAEVLHIGGETRAITLANNANPEDPFYKEADIWGYVVRGGWQNETITAVMEHGYASGDNEPSDATFTGRPIHPDHNVGLLLYEEVISRTTAAAWGDAGRGLWSNGGVYNSRYIFPNVRIRPMKNWELIAAGLVAWPDTPDGSRVLCAEGDDVECKQYNATASMLGWEADLALKYRFHDHILASVETGYAHATDRLPLEAAGLKTEVDDEGHEYGRYFTLQSRIAYEF